MSSQPNFNIHWDDMFDLNSSNTFEMDSNDLHTFRVSHSPLPTCNTMSTYPFPRSYISQPEHGNHLQNLQSGIFYGATVHIANLYLYAIPSSNVPTDK